MSKFDLCDKVIKILTLNGWSPSRKVNISEFERAICARKFFVHDRAREFMESFYGLTFPQVRSYVPGGIGIPPIIKYVECRVLGIGVNIKEHSYYSLLRRRLGYVLFPSSSVHYEYEQYAKNELRDYFNCEPCPVAVLFDSRDILFMIFQMENGVFVRVHTKSDHTWAAGDSYCIMSNINAMLLNQVFNDVEHEDIRYLEGFTGEAASVKPWRLIDGPPYLDEGEL